MSEQRTGQRTPGIATGEWRSTHVKLVFALLNIVGVVTASIAVFDLGPAWLLDEDLAPFLFDAVAVNVGLLVPVGAIFLAMLVGYLFYPRVLRPSSWR